MRTLFMWAVLSSALCGAQAATIHFDEFGTAPLVNANGVHIDGVLIGFSPGTAYYNQTIGTSGNAVFSIDPMLSGPTTETLTFSFGQNMSGLSFDVLLESIFPLDDSAFGWNGGPAYSVLLSNGQHFDGATEPQPDGFYSEGQFSYEGAAFNGAVVTFFSGTDAGGAPVIAFGVDNLTYQAPEPATLLFLGAGLVALGLQRRRRSR
jgi:hypothetical protein